MTEEQLLNELKKNPFVLAPMAGITDRPFRSFMREQNCGAVITELVSATGLQYNSEKTRKLMAFDETQHPVGIQIFGESLESLAIAAKEVEQSGADFVDMNFGCPVPKVVKKGAGAAILKDLVAMRNVLRTVKTSVNIPVTIKIRTGWDEESRNADQVTQVAYDEGITWVAIHGRTRAKGYSGLADWDYIAQIKAQSPLPVLGNGDIVTPEMANERLDQSGCDGVMIGRGCLKNPWIFDQALKLRHKHSVETGLKDFRELLARLRFHLERHCDDRIQMLQMKKFSSWYSAGYPGSANFRKAIFQVKAKDELYDRIDHFFEEIRDYIQADTSHEPFLMGGHG